MSASADIHFYRRMQRQADVASAALLLAECAESLGWNLAAFNIDLRRPDDLPRAHDGEFLSTTMGWRAQTVNDWVRLRLARHCPIGLYCTTTAEPFLWDCELGAQERRGERVPRDQQAVLRHYSNDVCGGVTVPVRRAGRTGYVSWCSRDRGSLRRTYRATLASVHLLSHAFMHQLDRLRDAQDRCTSGQGPLTPREVECLSWAARGRTTAEIAALLCRSAETVEFHLSNAMRKLQARSRAHAVAIACMGGIVEEL